MSVVILSINKGHYLAVDKILFIIYEQLSFKSFDLLHVSTSKLFEVFLVYFEAILLKHFRNLFSHQTVGIPIYINDTDIILLDIVVAVIEELNVLGLNTELRGGYQRSTIGIA